MFVCAMGLAQSIYLVAVKKFPIKSGCYLENLLFKNASGIMINQVHRL